MAHVNPQHSVVPYTRPTCSIWYTLYLSPLAMEVPTTGLGCIMKQSMLLPECPQKDIMRDLRLDRCQIVEVTFA